MTYANFGGGFVKKNEFEQDETRDKRTKERTRAGRKEKREQEERTRDKRTKERTRAGRKREREQEEKEREQEEICPEMSSVCKHSKPSPCIK